jgi:hypothetical protein
MPDKPQSSGERHIETIMQELDPTSERYRILDTAKRFKSSWVELGERLLAVSSRNLYQEWGYQSFDDYCAREIRIKKPTAQKLTLAYRYMEKEEPELLKRQHELKPLPDYRSVDLLRQAREERTFSDEEYADLRKSVIDEERSHPTVLKRFKETAAARGGATTDPAISLKICLAAARRLANLLSGVDNLPSAFGEQLGKLIAHLEGELASLPGREELI